MNFFFNGFDDELVKLAIPGKDIAKKLLQKMPKVDPSTMSWGLSRGATAGAAGAVSGGIMYNLYRGKADKYLPKAERRKRRIASMTVPGTMGAILGLTKGFAEKGIDRAILKALTKGKAK